MLKAKSRNTYVSLCTRYMFKKIYICNLGKNRRSLEYSFPLAQLLVSSFRG